MDWKAHVKALMAAGASLGQIAEAMGVTENAVRELLAGRTKSPRGNAAIRLAGLKPGDLGPTPEQEAA